VGFQKVKSLIHSLEVVNDCAKRGVTLKTDFKDVTKDVQQQKYLFHVIEAHRSHFKSYNKPRLQNFFIFKTHLFSRFI
jgi:hypothetical protein